MPNAAAEAKKNEGNTLFKAGKFSEAILKYNEATEIDPSMHTAFSNCAACHEKLGNFAEMENAARACINADPSFIKGYFRLATAHEKKNEYKAALDALTMGLAKEPRNKDLKKMQDDIKEKQRQEKVAQLIQSAKEKEKAGDFAEVIRVCDQGLALDGGNTALTAMRDKATPKYEAAEKKRKAGLSKTELLKEEGDKHYKAAAFEEAIKSYTKCIEQNPATELKVKALSNRSACYKQLSNFDGTIEDCSMVLEADPENVKAIIRRAQAFEAVERYKFALQDVKTVLSMPGDKVGAANWKLANDMQHRLNRVVAQLKASG